MMYYDDKIIRPFKGIDDIKLGESYQSVVNKLKLHKIIYTSGINPNKGCTPEIAWTTIYIKNYMSLVFAEDVLFQIYFKEKFKGSLPNGIKTNTLMLEARKIDKSLKLDDWDEVWQSNKGYWLFEL